MAYDPKSVESTIYQRWERSGFFNPDNLPGKRAKSFSIAMPPPNVTGDLHIGHALTITLEDVMTRYHRLRGEAALWLPGTDHAGIATQIRVERLLAENGTSRHDIGRDTFLKHVWAWKKKYGDTITEQIRSLGASCDWSREHFTMDKDLTDAVHAAFIRLFDDGLIYRAERLIHWCPNDRTALSDLEVKREERAGSLWHIQYRVKSTPHSITVATTRPETLYGDMAVAVHPKDERYKNLIGRTVIVPLVNREVPVIADHRVEAEFGTGAVKVTPAHDFMDAALAKTHKLPSLSVIGPDARMTIEAGRDLEGLPLHEARLLTVEALNRDGFLEKVEDYRSAVNVCDRCGTTAEPQLSQQWFVKMAPLAKKAVAAVRSGKIQILPKRFEKVYFHWLTNIEDWCISRQLWWGHRMPIWFCDTCGAPAASAAKPVTRCAKCKGTAFHQSEDVLDTWFSSGLWTFSTLGWPRNQKGRLKRGDLKRFHPTSVMETGWDILFFWVARMVMLSLYLVGEVPFRTVYLNGLILDKNGKKMSKSMGTGIDPLIMTEKYGTDALRLSLVIGQSAGQDFKMFEEKIAGQRNFVNKIWNIGQYVKSVGWHKKPQRFQAKSLGDRWILSRLAAVTKEATAALESKRSDFSAAGQALVDFTWHELADWYVEIHKVEKNDALLREVFRQTLILLHPLAPFVTEALWGELKYGQGAKDFAMIQSWPKAGVRRAAAEKSFAQLQRTIIALRNFKLHGGLKTEEGGSLGLTLSRTSERGLIEKLSGVPRQEKQPGWESITLGGVRCWFLQEHIAAYQGWRDKERTNLERYLATLTAQLKNKQLPTAIRDQVEEKRAATLQQLKDLAE